MIPSHVVRQNDFTAGQISDSALRSDDKNFVQSALKTATNTRLRGTGPIEARPGRFARFQQAGRTDHARMSPDTTVFLCFGDDGSLTVRGLTGVVRATDTGYPWDGDTVKDIVWARADNKIYVWFPGMTPAVLTWGGGTSWSFGEFEFFEDAQGKRYEPFYRYADIGITMSVSALTGTGIDIVFSEDVLNAAHVGFRFRYCGRQIEIVTVVDARNGTADVIEELPAAHTVAIAGGSGTTTAGFNVGDAVEGATSGAEGVVMEVVDASTLIVQLTKNFDGFQNAEYIVGPYGRAQVGTSTAVADPTDYPVTIWDEAACSDVQGWPQSGFSDQDRLGMCDHPGIQNGIMWSAIAAYTNFLPGDDPDQAMFERLNSQDRVYHVAAGADEFVFTDTGVRYIPISESNPLKPGSVAFRDISAPPASSVKPLSTADGVVYVDAGGGTLVAIAPTGQTTQPYVARTVSEFHSALFVSPICLAATTGDSDIPERYIYAVNSDGTLAVGRVDRAKEWVGWVPWDGEGDVKWATGLDNALLLTTEYPDSDTAVVERVASTGYLDAQISYNDVPPELEPDPGDGPLWWYAGGTVHVMDGLRYLGTREVDADGFLVPEQGEVFTSDDIIVGLNWTTTIAPFIRHAPQGQSSKQTLRKRKIKRFGVYVQNSLGFMCGNTRIPPWLQGEDQAGQPPLREQAYFFRVSGRAVDPEVEIVRDLPGSLRINEISYEVTV